MTQTISFHHKGKLYLLLCLVSVPLSILSTTVSPWHIVGAQERRLNEYPPRSLANKILLLCLLCPIWSDKLWPNAKHCNNSSYVQNIQRVSGIFLNPWHVVIHLFFITTLWNKYLFYRWGNWTIESLGNLSQVRGLISGRGRMWSLSPEAILWTFC